MYRPLWFLVFLPTLAVTLDLAVPRQRAAADEAGLPLTLVAGGQPRAEIVVAPERPRMVTLAALELQHSLRKISGARLAIVTAPTISPDATAPASPPAVQVPGEQDVQAVAA